MPGGTFISAIFLLPQDDRCDDAMILYTFHKCLHILVHTDFVRMVGHVVNLVQRNIMDTRQFAFFSAFIGHE